MIELVLPNIYRIEIELPNNPLRTINCYVIKDSNRNLIIDTAMNRKECRTALESSLLELEIDLAVTDLLITHMHADHSGLVSSFQNLTTRIFCSEVDAASINAMGSDDFWDEMRIQARLNGFPGKELVEAVDHHPGHKYCNKHKINFETVQEDTLISAGGYQFYCIETPGHTPGHLCLYEPERKILISGDHLLQDISPTVMLWTDEGNPLQEYLQSLAKILELDVDLVLPGHRRVFKDCRSRIAELTEHHRARASEALAVLSEGPQNAYSIASQMRWDIKCSSWQEFPPQQKLFACGEVLSHLKYLREEGQAVMERQENGIFFRRN